MEDKKFYWKKWLGAFLFGAALITLYKTFDNLGRIFEVLGDILSLFTPFTIGFIFAFFLYPATVRLEEKLSVSKKAFLKRHAKTVSILTVYFSFMALLIIAISFILPNFSSSLAEFLKKLPIFAEELTLFLTNWAQGVGFLEHTELESLTDSVNASNIFSSLFLNDVWSYVEGVKGVTGVLMSWVMGFVICAYALLERESLFKIARVFFGLFLKEQTTVKAGVYIHRISTIFYKFFFGKMIDSLIIGILALIGFTLLKVPYALVMAVIVMVFNMIPYFGPIIGAVPVVLVSLLVKDLYAGIWTGLFIFLLQQFDGIWLGPKILGGSVGISPFWVIFAILIFGNIFGIWGMIFGVPMIAAIRMLAEDYIDDGKLNLSAEPLRAEESKEK